MRNLEFKTTGDASIDGRSFESFVSLLGSESKSNILQELSLADFCDKNTEQIRSELTQSLNTFFQGLETPEKYNQDLDVLKNLGKIPYPRQARLIVAGCSYFANKQKSLILSSEMGTGKTLMSISMVATFLLKRNKFGNIAVLCPNHLKKKWEKEIREIFSNHINLIEIHIIKTGEEFIRKSAKPCGNKIRFFIFSKESAKLGYRLSEAYPVPLEKRDDQRYHCKVCGSSFDLEKVAKDKEKHRKRCTGKDGEIREASFYVKTRAKMYCCDKCCLQHNLDALYPSFSDYLKSSPRKLDRTARRLSIAKAIRTKPKGFFEFFIADEVHELKGDTGQGQAFASISEHSKRIMGLTGTLLNGYASSLYYNLWRMFPRLMKNDLGLGFKTGLSIFIAKFGAFSYVEEDEISEKNGTVVNKKSNSRATKEIPEINPILIKLLLQNTLFLKLDEMNVPLPDYSESVITVKIDSEIFPAYSRYVDSLFDDLVGKRMSGLLGAFCNHSLSILDAPSVPVEYVYKGKKYSYKPEVTEDFISNKERKLIDLVQQELSGRKVLVYSHYRESTERIYRLLLRHFADKRISLLTSNIGSGDREEWITKEQADILIANPELVKTGLDLLEYPSIIFYETGMITSTLEQASRRSWRIGQSQECRVFFLAFDNSAQMHSLKIMSGKIRAVNNVRGRLLMSKNELSAVSCSTNSVQEAMVNSLMLSEEVKLDDIDSKWIFKSRKLDIFEQYYENYIPTNRTIKTPAILRTTVSEPQTEEKDKGIPKSISNASDDLQLFKNLSSAFYDAIPKVMGVESNKEEISTQGIETINKPRVLENKPVEESTDDVEFEVETKYHRNIPKGCEIFFFQDGDFDPEEWEEPYLCQEEKDRLALRKSETQAIKEAILVSEEKEAQRDDFDHNLYKKVVNRDGTVQLAFNFD